MPPLPLPHFRLRSSRKPKTVQYSRVRPSAYVSVSGYHQPLECQAQCVECEAGMHQPKSGAVECVPCQYSMSSAAGSEECTVCAAGYYLRPGSAASTSNCVPCPLGATCRWNTTVATLQVHPGWWRLSNLTATLYDCSESASRGSNDDSLLHAHGNWTHGDGVGIRACKGGAPGEYGDSLCEEFHSGPRKLYRYANLAS